MLKADRQLCTGIYLLALVSCHNSAQQLLASTLSFYLHMHIFTLCNLQVSESYTLHNFPFVPDISRTITSEPSKGENQTLVAKSTAFA